MVSMLNKLLAALPGPPLQPSLLPDHRLLLLPPRHHDRRQEEKGQVQQRHAVHLPLCLSPLLHGVLLVQVTESAHYLIAHMPWDIPDGIDSSSFDLDC